LHINTQTTPNPYGTDANICVLDARNHYPQIKHHTPPPKWSNNTPPTPHRGQGKTGLLSQSPIVCPMIFAAGIPAEQQVCRAPEPETHYRPGPSNESPHSP
jgi:hypothetical protein